MVIKRTFFSARFPDGDWIKCFEEKADGVSTYSVVWQSEIPERQRHHVHLNPDGVSTYSVVWQSENHRESTEFTDHSSAIEKTAKWIQRKNGEVLQALFVLSEESDNDNNNPREET